MENKINKAASNSIYSVEDFLIISYERKYFPGSVIKNAEEGYIIKTMAACGSYWKWSDKEDVLIYLSSDIICKIPDPELMNSRGQYYVPMIHPH